MKTITFLQVPARKRLHSGLKTIKVHSVKGDNSFIRQENLMGNAKFHNNTLQLQFLSSHSFH